MKPSLSVLLSIRNAQSAIAGLVSKLMEIVPELAARHEVLIIDDGSTDATAEVAFEIARAYPQVRLAAQSGTRGRRDPLAIGLAQTTGDWVLHHPHNCPAELLEIPKLWKQIERADVVLGRSASHESVGSISRLVAKDQAAWQNAASMLQLIRRRSIEVWRVSAAHELALGYLTRHGFAVVEVNIRERNSWSPEGAWPVHPQRIDRSAHAREPARPNFLGRLKAFAWGE